MVLGTRWAGQGDSPSLAQAGCIHASHGSRAAPAQAEAHRHPQGSDLGTTRMLLGLGAAALTVTVRFSQAMLDTSILLLSQKRRVSLLGWVGASHLQLGGENPTQG